MGLLGLGAVAAIAAGVYVTGGEQGNRVAAACQEAAAKTARLEPLAQGEVAAFQVSATPQWLADLPFTAPDGTAVTLADFAGQVVLVNLWATWCVPCREEMPALDRLARERGGDDFMVLPINLDVGDPAKPGQFLAEIGAEALPLYADPALAGFNRLKNLGMVYGLPTTLLIDPAGCVLGVMAGPAEWDSPDARALIEAAIPPQAV